MSKAITTWYGYCEDTVVISPLFLSKGTIGAKTRKVAQQQLFELFHFVKRHTPLSNAAKNLECASFGAKTTHARRAKPLKTETMDTHAAVVQTLLQKITMQISAAKNLPVVTGLMTRAPQKTSASANRTASQYCVI